MLVPADATNSARQATIIAGDSRRSLSFKGFLAFSGAAEKRSVGEYRIPIRRGT
jgi:hypothetical protein